MKNKAGWVCDNGHYFNGFRGDLRVGDTQVTCETCGEGMSWMSEAPPRFDAHFQVYRHPDGTVATDDDCGIDLELSFPCQRCYAPAEMLDINNYYERYKCSNCNHITKVS